MNIDLIERLAWPFSVNFNLNWPSLILVFVFGTGEVGRTSIYQSEACIEHKSDSLTDKMQASEIQAVSMLMHQCIFTKKMVMSGYC